MVNSGRMIQSIADEARDKGEHLTAINPYRHHSGPMGQKLGKFLHMMFSNHPNQTCKYIYLIDTRNGDQTKIEIEQDPPDQTNEFIKDGRYL